MHKCLVRHSEQYLVKKESKHTRPPLIGYLESDSRVTGSTGFYSSNYAGLRDVLAVGSDARSTREVGGRRARDQPIFDPVTHRHRTLHSGTGNETLCYPTVVETRAKEGRGQGQLFLFPNRNLFLVLFENTPRV